MNGLRKSSTSVRVQAARLTDGGLRAATTEEAEQEAAE